MDCQQPSPTKRPSPPDATPNSIHHHHHQQQPEEEESEIARSRLLAISQAQPTSMASASTIAHLSLLQPHPATTAADTKANATSNQEEEFRLKLMAISSIDSTSVADSEVKLS